MDKTGVLVPSTRGRMAHMLCGKSISVPSAKMLVWKSKVNIRMAKGGMLAPSMRGKMVHILRRNNPSVPSARKLVWRKEGGILCQRGIGLLCSFSVLPPSGPPLAVGVKRLWGRLRTLPLADRGG
jgi:hypothetical protein